MMETLETRMLFSYLGGWQVTAPSTAITKYVAPSLNAQSNDVSIDTVQLSPETLTVSANSDLNP